ncbi:calcium-binding protein [Inquilinus sp. CA228]|uniref:calcium-binding protein n=1 Tax=Inquilinus sp. CA228 TaxID=3455609 RepID=UPI003F8D71D2
MAIINGGNSKDILVGTDGDDTINGFGGNDLMVGLGGNDQILGGTGSDEIGGQAGNDTLDGGTGNDQLSGGENDDSLIGGAGVDRLDGGAGIDLVGYAFSTLGVTVNLQVGTGSGGDAQGDTLIGIEQVFGSNHADTLTGDAGANRLWGWIGNDRLNGGAGDDILETGSGFDIVDGGAGTDVLIMDRSTDTGNFTFTLNGPAGTGGASAVGIERMEFFAGAGNNTITGGSGNDSILDSDRVDGNDVLNGGAGDDRLMSSRGVDTLDGGAGIDRAVVLRFGVMADLRLAIDGTTASDGTRILNVESLEIFSGEGDDDITGGSQRDFIVGSGGDDVLRGGAGADHLDGSVGIDTASYFTSTIGVAVNLATGTGSGGEAQGDTLSEIEILSGSQGNDSLVGDTNANTLQGWDGGDVLSGAGGQDTLTGGAGGDRFVYGSAAQSPVGANADRITDFSRAEADRIDLSAIDANTVAAGDQAFSFIGTATYTGVAGQLRFAQAGGVTTVAGDINGDAVSDFHIVLTGTIALVAADFVL